MTRRGKPRGNTGRYGLFNNPDTPDSQLGDNPLTRPCPHCKAAPRQPCTSPSRHTGGRRNLHTFHPSRTDPSTPETHQENSP